MSDELVTLAQERADEVERLWRDLTAADGTIDQLRTELAQQDQDLKTAREDVLRLTAERDTARAEVQRLLAERDQPKSQPKGREVGRFGLDGHYLDAMEPMRTTDEGIWREAIMTLLPSYPPQKAAEHADGVLAEYRKRWLR